MCNNVFILLLSCLTFIFTIYDGHKVVAVKVNASSNDQTEESPDATENQSFQI
jgi:hypothetical protein